MTILKIGLDDRPEAAEIAMLSEQNRIAVNRELEARLVDLRMEAGAGLRLNAGTLKAPEYPDPFAGCISLPEVSGAELNATVLGGALLHHGGLLVRGLYSKRQLERLQRLAAQQEEIDREDHSPLGTSPHTLFELLETYRESGLLDTVNAYLDGQPLMFAERIKLRQHRAQTHKHAAIPWHQDASFFGGKSWAVNCWAAVTSCGDGNPGLGVIPRRTENHLGWNPADGLAPLDYGNSMPQQELAALCAGRPREDVVLQPGDALLFDEMTVHRTNSRPWRLPKQIVTISWFFRASGFPEWGTPLAV
ncbi:MAG: phytanoyl-CoA dioxygenase family protein [Halioglobus sp.]